MPTLGLGRQVSTPSSYCLYNYQLMHDNLGIRVQCFAAHYWSDLHPYGEVLCVPHSFHQLESGQALWALLSLSDWFQQPLSVDRQCIFSFLAWLLRPASSKSLARDCHYIIRQRFPRIWPNSHREFHTLVLKLLKSAASAYSATAPCEVNSTLNTEMVKMQLFAGILRLDLCEK